MTVELLLMIAVINAFSSPSRTARSGASSIVKDQECLYFLYAEVFILVKNSV
jgi:hypothetical protein